MSFILVDKVLLFGAFAYLSAEAKLLYALLVDRLSLSKKNGEAWVNKYKETFVYFTNEEIQKLFTCSHSKASSIVSELETAGLIKRYRQGLGRPWQIVVSDTHNTNYLMAVSPKSSNNNINISASSNTKLNNTESINTYPLSSCANESEIKEKICYDVLQHEFERSLLDSLVDVICETLNRKDETATISGKTYTKQQIQDCITNVDDMHARYICDRLLNEEHMIYSPRGYILKHLFDTEHEIDLYYSLRVSHDIRKRRD